MRRKLAALGLAAGLTSAFLPVSSAHAICDENYRKLTGDCGVCHTLARVIPDLICFD